MIDKEEKIRSFINMQYVKMKSMAAVGSLLLLTINLSFTIYPYLEHRFSSHIFGIPRTWIGVPLVFLTILLIIWIGAHIYIKKLEMYRTEKKAEMVLNPYAIYAFTPFQEMWFAHIYKPMMNSIEKLLPEGKEKEEMKKECNMVNDWIESGIIPKKDFPKYLKPYYITKKKKRV